MDTRPEDPLERRRDELRRLVYGTPDGASAEIQAELLEIERAMASAVREREVVVETAETNEPGDQGLVETGVLADHTRETPDAATSTVAVESEPQTPPSRRRWPTGWRGVALLAGALVVVAVTATMLALGPLRDVTDPPRGLSIFDRAQTTYEVQSAGRIVDAADLRPEATGALRSLGRLFGHDFWAYRVEDLVCLVTQRLYWYDWIQTCETVNHFERYGINRRIPIDDISEGARPGGVGSDDVIVVNWGARSIELQWRIALLSERGP